MLWKSLEGELFTYKYYLKKLLGVGGFGAVFSADEVIGDQVIREVAVKVMQVDPDNKKRQLDELIISTKLKHFALLNCISPEQAEIEKVECWGLVMELAQGSLADRLKKSALTNAEIETLVKQMAEGLQYLHSQNVVHRDVKPANLLSVNNNWKIGDFGIARMLDAGKEEKVTTNQVGTDKYMPPEAYNGNLQFTCDWWSLGIIVIEAATGNFAFGEYTTPLQLMKKVVNEEPTIPDALSPALQEIVRGCLIKEPQKRWTAKQVLDALTPVLTTPIKGSVGSVGFSGSSLIKGSWGGSNQSFTENLPNGIALEMIAIPAGSFMMGSTDGADYEKPQHQVTLNAFHIGKYPITQEQYQAVIGNNPSYFVKGGKYPVDSVSWEDAQAFCEKLSKMTGKTYRLPSESEWEYACRTGKQTRYYFGDNENQLKEYAWYDANSNSQTQPVGQKKPNKWGLYDVLGNVWEWSEDDWHSNYNGAPTDGRAWIDNNNRSQFKDRIIRGGSWCDGSRFCSCSYRYFLFAAWRDNVIGFRVVC